MSALRSLSLEELSKIEVVTAEKQPESIAQTPAAVFVITETDIRRSGATTLPDVLRLAPGVIVNQSDGNRWAVGIRGFADIFSKSVLVLIDGRSVYSPLVGGVHWAIQDLVLADIQQIEVIRGPGASIWGANAVNGVINIVTKRPSDTAGLETIFAAGTVDRASLSVRYGGRASGRVDYRVYAKAFTRTPQFHSTGADFDEWRAAQAGFRGEWRPAPRHSVTVSGDLYRTRTGERADVSHFDPPRVETIDGPIDLSGGNLLVRWDHVSATGRRVRLQSYFDRTTRNGFTFREVRDTVDADFNVQIPLGRHQLASGAHIRRSPSTVTQVVPTLNFLPQDHTFVAGGAFVQNEIALQPSRLWLTLGARAEYNAYTGTEVLPSARVLWNIGPRQQSAWASVTRAQRTPSRFERDLRFTVLVNPAIPLFALIRGNDQFEAESVWSLEGGYRALLTTGLHLDVALFRNAYDGLAGFGEPVVLPQVSPRAHLLAAIPFENAVDAQSAGFEITPDWKPTPYWRVRGSYSHLRINARNRAGFGSAAARDAFIGLAPRHQFRLHSQIDLPGDFELDHVYRWVDALMAHGVPSYHTLDARVGWRLSNQLDLAIVGKNLLQPHHPEFGAVPVEIKRSAYAQLTLRK